MSKKFQWGQTSIKRMDGVDPRIIRVLFRAIRIMSRKKDGIDMTIPWMGGIRTADQQNKLFLDGVSKCDGFKKKSEHQSGLAIDVIPYIKGINFYEMPSIEQDFLFYKVASVILEAGALEGVKISWGGNWSSWRDCPHYQIK